MTSRRKFIKSGLASGVAIGAGNLSALACDGQTPANQKPWSDNKITSARST